MIRKAVLAVFAISVVPVGPAFAHHAPAAGEMWPICDSARTQFCVEALTVDGVDELGGNNWRMHVSLLESDDGIDGFNWLLEFNVPWGPPTAGMTNWVSATINTGDVVPRYSYGYGVDASMTRGGNATDGYTIRADGAIQTVRWKISTVGGNCFVGECGDDTTMADTELGAFGGFSQELAAGELAFDGVWTFNDAQYDSEPRLFGEAPNRYWVVELGNPHLDMAGDPVIGAYSAFLGPPMLATMGITPSEAAAAGLLVRRNDGGTVTTIGAAIMPYGGGVYFRIPSLPYSTPRLRIRAGDGVGLSVPPDRVVDVSATPLDGGVVVRFSRPFFDGGERIDRYRVRCVDGEDSYRTVVVRSAVAVEVLELPNGLQTNCEVRAVNAAGGGAWSPLLPVTPQEGLPPIAPGAVQASSARVRDDGALHAAWGLVGSTGGSPVTSYRLDLCRVDGACPAQSLLSRTTTSRELTIGSAALPSGRIRVMIAARNAVGRGSARSVVLRIPA